jgi:hypothetical protein
MMLLIEYLNVKTQGSWQNTLKNKRWGQYLLASLLGALPGCLGAFTVVSLYSHRVFTLGSLVATMIATSGDESFVMFAMFPETALWLHIILFIIGIAAGYATDLIFKNQDQLIAHLDHQLPIHEREHCNCFQKDEIWNQLKHIKIQRASLMAALLVFLSFLAFSAHGEAAWDWKRITFTASAAFGLFVVSTVPDHFLSEHLWKHIVRKHLPAIFLWTFGALLVIHYLEGVIDLKTWIQDNYFLTLIISLLVGIIPESGPHLIFVTMFAEGSLPLSILMANSIVQDGHGMLPMLAVSRKGFILVKAINIFIGLLVGLIGFIIFN